MVCFKSGAYLAVLFGAALFCRTVDADPQVTGVTDACLLPTNLARTARLNTRLSLLTKDAATEAAVGTSITDNNLGGNDNNCAVNAAATPTNVNVAGFTTKFAFGTAFNCSSIVANMVTAGLAALASYPNQPWDNGAAAPYNTADVQNLMYMLYAPATGLGCSRTTGCTAGDILMICRTTPGLTAQYNQPVLTQAFYDALKERQAKNIDLTKLTAADLNTTLEGKQPSSAVILAIPGVIPATALTLTSLLGFASSVH